jgi:hypothetical protein
VPTLERFSEALAGTDKMKHFYLLVLGMELGIDP